jgi:hypothetical protein
VEESLLVAYRKKRQRKDFLVWTVSLLLLMGWLTSFALNEDFPENSKKVVAPKIASISQKYKCPESYLDKNSNDYCAKNSTVEVIEWRVSALNVSRINGFMGRELCFKVKLENLDESARTFAESDFRLRWPSGQVRDLWTDFSTSGTLDSAPLSSGGYATGRVCFNDPGESGEYMLIFKPSLKSERGIWFYNLTN